MIKRIRIAMTMETEISKRFIQYLRLESVKAI